MDKWMNDVIGTERDCSMEAWSGSDNSMLIPPKIEAAIIQVGCLQGVSIVVSRVKSRRPHIFAERVDDGQTTVVTRLTVTHLVRVLRATKTTRRRTAATHFLFLDHEDCCCCCCCYLLIIYSLFLDTLIYTVIPTHIHFTQ